MATTSPGSECDSRPAEDLDARASAGQAAGGQSRVEFAFDDPAFQADPYPTYAELREREPICFRKTDEFEVCWLTRYRDVVALLRHPGFSAARTPSGMMEPGVPEKFRRLGHLLTQMMLMKDAPDHSKDDFVLLSGTAVREMLGKGIAPPPEFSRPEVAKILSDYYQTLDS